MKLTSFVCALLAGTALSAVASADPGQAGGGAIAAPTILPDSAYADAGIPQRGPKLYPVGARQPEGPVVRGPVLLPFYDTIGTCTGFNYLTLKPAAILDDGSFTPGPVEGVGGDIPEMDVMVLRLPADGPIATINLRVTVWDNCDLTGAVNPIQSTELFTGTYVIEGQAINTGGGLWIFTLDTTGLSIPDDDWAVEVAFLDAVGGNILPNGQLTSAFPGPACAPTQPNPGSNQAIFWVDNDLGGLVGDGIRYEFYVPGGLPDQGDAVGFAAGGPLNGLGLTMTGLGTPPLPSGACCIAGACVIRTGDDCAAQGGTYNGDDSNCNGTYSYTASSTPFTNIPDNDPMGVTDSITIGAGVSISDLDIGLVIEHTYQGDLIVTLTHVETGSSADLILNPGAGGFAADNFGDILTNEPFLTDDAAEFIYGDTTPSAGVVGRWKPATPLSVFNGENSAGTWNLTIVDTFAADVGVLYQWGLIVNQPNDTCPEGPAFCVADWCQDGTVGVPDIFCFLGEWFAGVPAAVNFGGDAGVPAIFAFLATWFATPQGPCTP